jgi:hypothetical protein
MADRRAVGALFSSGTQVLNAPLAVAALLHVYNLLDVLCLSHGLQIFPSPNRDKELVPAVPNPNLPCQ